jgi:UDP-N-acetylglucosamine--dolichyl-phosphate N-acetylglucosaminephosphotransferase
LSEDYYSIVFAAFLSFLSAYLTTPIFISFMRAAGIVGRDVMKREKPVVADMGGPGVLFGFLTGIFYYIGIQVFLFGDLSYLDFLLASISTILIISLIGIFDTLTSLMKEREGKGMFERMKRRGIPQWLYFLIPLPAAVPLAAVNAGVSSMALPFLGRVNFGQLYPLVLLPVAILMCSNATNMLAGFNGLEAGMGSVLHLSLGLYALINGRTASAAIALSFAAALLAFLRYNWYPAKVYPGDLNHTIGATCVCVAVVGNIERYAILCFAPWILEAFLKLRSRFKAENYGLLQQDGTLKSPSTKIYSLTHLVMRLSPFREWEVSLILILFEVAVCAVSYLLLFYRII